VVWAEYYLQKVPLSSTVRLNMLKYMPMEDEYLYRQIAEAVRQQILKGVLKGGDRLPPVREMTARWGCTLGTVQHAYRELARQGLVVSRAGQGTRVLEGVATAPETPLRRASLVHRAEGFLLEVLTAGYTPSDVEDAVRVALERWRTTQQGASPAAAGELRFVGSHDPAVAWLAGHFGEIAAGTTLSLSFVGSLGGLIALAQGQADLAGCHLWDEESDTYNRPFVRRLLPGQRLALLTLGHRRLGLIFAAGNPAAIGSLADLTRLGLRFVNRQAGSGTRVWLDAALRHLGMDGRSIHGFDEEVMTHSAVARLVAEGQADVGLGLESAARAYGLGFAALTRERYDLAIPQAGWQQPSVQALAAWLASPAAKELLNGLGGYEAAETGAVQWVG